ncbi:putative leucine-rich repeat protein [Tanacetum coccineum]
MALLSFSSSAFFPWLLLVSSLCTICFCNKIPHNVLCKQTERSALIQFKNNLTDKANRLSSWSGDDCCSWSGVVCDDVTGHVLEIRLRGPDDETKGHCHGSYDTNDQLEEASNQMLGGNISYSLIKLVQLRYLDLSCNDFGLIPVPTFIGSLKNLTYLNISKSQFGGEVPQKLGNLSMLRVLALQDDKFFSYLYSNNLRWLRNLKQLQHLDMAGINLTEASDWLQVLRNYLNISKNNIQGKLGDVSFYTEALVDLSFTFSGNCISGAPFHLSTTVLTQGLLESLDLSVNRLNGKIPMGLSRLASLSLLNVSYNNLIGEIPTSTQLQSMSKYNFIGNALCGAPLSSCQQTSVDSEEVNNKSDESDGFDWILVICAVGGLIVGFWVVVAPLYGGPIGLSKHGDYQLGGIMGKEVYKHFQLLGED